MTTYYVKQNGEYNEFIADSDADALEQYAEYEVYLKVWCLQKVGRRVYPDGTLGESEVLQ